MNSKIKLPRSIKIDKAKKICELYGEGEYTIATCCDTFDIKYNTFQQWAQPNLTQEDIEKGGFRRGFVQDVHDLYKRALERNEANYKALLKDATRKGLMMRASGTRYTETLTEAKLDVHGNPFDMVIRKIERIVLPDTGILIFLAKNLFQGYFQHQTYPITQDSVLKNPLQNLTKEQLEIKRIELMESDGNSSLY